MAIAGAQTYKGSGGYAFSGIQGQSALLGGQEVRGLGSPAEAEAIWWI